MYIYIQYLKHISGFLSVTQIGQVDIINNDSSLTICKTTCDAMKIQTIDNNNYKINASC